MVATTNNSFASGSKSTTPPVSPSASSGCERTADLLSACDKALNDQVVLNHDRQRVIEAQDAHILKQKDKIKQLTDENKSILRNPWLWFGLGLVTGALVTK